MPLRWRRGTNDTSMTFKQHVTNIKNKVTPRLNALRSLANTTFGHDKETTKTVYKQYIRSVMDYGSPAWAPNLAETHHNTLQTIQNKALKIITGCTATTPTDHIHQETKVLKVKDHLDMRGTQTLAAAITNNQHPLNYMAQHPHTPRNIKTTPNTRYHTQILSSLPPCPPKPASRNTFTTKSLTDPSKHSRTTPYCIHVLPTSTLPNPPSPERTESTWPG